MTVEVSQIDTATQIERARDTHATLAQAQMSLMTRLALEVEGETSKQVADYWVSVIERIAVRMDEHGAAVLDAMDAIVNEDTDKARRLNKARELRSGTPDAQPRS
jgi:hypothetical protein